MEKEKIDAYREEIVEALLQKANQDQPDAMTEDQAKALSQYLSDDELADGIDWNTPEDVADTLLESGLLDA